MFNIGDRVRSLKDDGRGLACGETGTVIAIDNISLPVVRWDEFNPVRHNAGSRTEDGHGWYIFSSESIELLDDIDDLGEFAPSLAPGSISELLGC